jgi:hypothetical protein
MSDFENAALLVECEGLYLDTEGRWYPDIASVHATGKDAVVVERYGKAEHYAWWDSAQHPRGQPENKGEFAPKGAASQGGSSKPKPKGKDSPVRSALKTLLMSLIERRDQMRGGQRASSHVGQPKSQPPKSGITDALKRQGAISKSIGERKDQEEAKRAKVEEAAEAKRAKSEARKRELLEADMEESRKRASAGEQKEATRRERTESAAEIKRAKNEARKRELLESDMESSRQKALAGEEREKRRGEGRSRPQKPSSPQKGMDLTEGSGDDERSSVHAPTKPWEPQQELPKSGIPPRMMEGIRAVAGENPQDQEGFFEQITEVHGRHKKAAEEHNAQLENFYSQFAKTSGGSKLLGQLKMMAMRGDDVTKIPGFDQVLDHAQKYTPSLLTAHDAADPESALVNNLLRGRVKAPALDSDEVFAEAKMHAERMGAFGGESNLESERQPGEDSWRDLLDDAPARKAYDDWDERNAPKEDDDVIPFQKLNYQQRKWFTAKLSRFRYARQLGLFDSHGPDPANSLSGDNASGSGVGGQSITKASTTMPKVDSSPTPPAPEVSMPKPPTVSTKMDTGMKGMSLPKTPAAPKVETPKSAIPKPAAPKPAAPKQETPKPIVASASPPAPKDAPLARKAAWEMTPEEFHGGVTFKTSQGSLYHFGDGYTTRLKTPHEGHDAKDVGLKRPSDHTVFVDPDFAREIGMWQTSSASGKRVVLGNDGHVHLVSVNPKTGTHGRDGKGKFSLQPQVGMAPVEVWDKNDKGWFRANHPGNPISELNPQGAYESFLEHARSSGKGVSSAIPGSTKPAAPKPPAAQPAVAKQPSAPPPAGGKAPLATADQHALLSAVHAINQRTGGHGLIPIADVIDHLGWPKEKVHSVGRELRVKEILSSAGMQSRAGIPQRVRDAGFMEAGENRTAFTVADKDAMRKHLEAGPGQATPAQPQAPKPQNAPAAQKVEQKPAAKPIPAFEHERSKAVLDAIQHLDRKSGGHNYVSLADLSEHLGWPAQVVHSVLHPLRVKDTLTLSSGVGSKGVDERTRAASKTEAGNLLTHVSFRR